MIVLLLENTRPSLRGEVNRWLLEIRPGLFVGNLSALVRDELWQRITTTLDASQGAALLLSPSRNEQGFHLQTHGAPKWCPLDFEGLALMQRPLPRTQKELTA